LIRANSIKFRAVKICLVHFLFRIVRQKKTLKTQTISQETELKKSTSDQPGDRIDKEYKRSAKRHN